MFFVEHDSGNLGSDYAFFCGLKTLNGVRKRVTNGHPPGLWNIYAITEGRKYDRASYRLVGTVTIAKNEENRFFWGGRD